MTQPATSLAWVRPTTQARSKATVDRFHGAAEALLVENSWEQISVERIARQALSSVGAFYTRFADKDALLSSLHERFTREAIATIDAVLSPERWEGHSIPEIIRESVIFTVEIYRDRACLLRAFLVKSATDDDFRDRSMAISRHIGERLRKLILMRRKELLHPAPAIASEFSARLIHGLLTQRVLLRANGDETSIKLSDDQITTELIHAVLAYLGVFTTESLDS